MHTNIDREAGEAERVTDAEWDTSPLPPLLPVRDCVRERDDERDCGGARDTVGARDSEAVSDEDGDDDAEREGEVFEPKEMVAEGDVEAVRDAAMTAQRRHER